jgi:hypothetical protein
VLDACLAQDATSKVALETLVKEDLVVLAGEIKTGAVVDYEQVVGLERVTNPLLTPAVNDNRVRNPPETAVAPQMMIGSQTLEAPILGRQRNLEGRTRRRRSLFDAGGMIEQHGVFSCRSK